MSIDAGSTKGLEDFVVADINAVILKRLREEHLYHFIRARDELYRLERSDDSETIRLLRRQSLRMLEKTWRNILGTLRSELPKGLDQLLSKLQPEFQAMGGSPIRGKTASNPPSPSTEVPRLLGRAHAPGLQTIQESGAAVTGGPVSPRKRKDSATIAPEFRVVKDIDELSIATEEAMPIDLTNKPTQKRPLAREEVQTTSPKKKARRAPQMNLGALGSSVHRPIKTNMFLHEVKPRECIFSYGDYAGFYVLRCNQAKCKKGLGKEEGTIFTSHPFSDGLALEHFAKEWHGLSTEADIFSKFAIRVIDADSERNTDTIDKAGVPTSDGNVSGVDQLPPGAATDRSRLKGKEPERRYPSRSSPKMPAAEASTSASAAYEKETFVQSFYRAGALEWVAEEDKGTSPALGTGRQADGK
ncbi:hypothetical protein F5B22DRAFT_606504 [Xylaria bambusicola]|uniref:uncharacterized protein n=1 Tax=Xylaria bambusicola TaxID=326684 RepID=UPI0020087B63|nr:uncharacterized protein F5B22DRAFT_606504 [Xylaria bambusicola]KAI0516789.1 hypothetical protein F5B22DRAFT_606504 [Xylaria bambusicola]